MPADGKNIPPAELSEPARFPWVYFLLSYLIPLLGIVLFFVYKKNPERATARAAKVCLVLALVGVATWCLLAVIFSIVGKP